MTDEAETALGEYIARRMRRPRFSNARSIRNALERARLRQAKRLFDAGGQPTRDDLMTIEAEDILASRVFGNDGEGEADADADNIDERDATPVAAAAGS
jgi:hypothetical protein